jgi:hypothetical protein
MYLFDIPKVRDVISGEFAEGISTGPLGNFLLHLEKGRDAG